MDVLTAVDADRIASDLESTHQFWLDLVDPSEVVAAVAEVTA